jgi:hypothetical protein
MKQSIKAQREGICHTHEECKAMYSGLSGEIKSPALTMLKDELSKSSEEIISKYKQDPDYWWSPYHFSWGMSVRNLLREKGFGENYFSIHNLDDIYINLVEEALELRK